jgi:hypothetical protein
MKKKEKNHSRRNEKKNFLLLYFEKFGVVFFDTKKICTERATGWNEYECKNIY